MNLYQGIVNATSTNNNNEVSYPELVLAKNYEDARNKLWVKAHRRYYNPKVYKDITVNWCEEVDSEIILKAYAHYMQSLVSED